MSDFTRSRGCGAPLFTNAAEETTLRSAACAALVDADERATSSCGCGCGRNSTSRSSCPCGRDRDNDRDNDRDDSATREGCTCCKASMRDALKLLCSNRISDLLDFDGFAFVTDDLIVGAEPVEMCPRAKDNLSALRGTFRRFSPCNCDLIDIEGKVHGIFCRHLDVDQATLCSLSAIAFQVEDADEDDHDHDRDSDRERDSDCDRDRGRGRDRDRDRDCGCDCLGSPEARYRRVRDLLQCELRTFDRACGECICHCNCTDDCCCAQGVLTALSGQSLNKRATLIAGLLALRNVTVLGTIGNVLVLGNDDDFRFYFVCANKVEMLA